MPRSALVSAAVRNLSNHNYHYTSQFGRQEPQRSVPAPCSTGRDSSSAPWPWNVDLEQAGAIPAAYEPSQGEFYLVDGRATSAASDVGNLFRYSRADRRSSSSR